jgi:hypothetical protein
MDEATKEKMVEHFIRVFNDPTVEIDMTDPLMNTPAMPDDIKDIANRLYGRGHDVIAEKVLDVFWDHMLTPFKDVPEAKIQ